MNSPNNSRWGGRASSPKENQDRVPEQGNAKLNWQKYVSTIELSGGFDLSLSPNKQPI